MKVKAPACSSAIRKVAGWADFQENWERSFFFFLGRIDDKGLGLRLNGRVFKALFCYRPSLIHKSALFNIFCHALFSRGHVLNSKINTRMIMVDKGKIMKKQRRCYPPGSGIFKPRSINSIMSCQPSKRQYRVIA